MNHNTLIELLATSVQPDADVTLEEAATIIRVALRTRHPGLFAFLQELLATPATKIATPAPPPAVEAPAQLVQTQPEIVDAPTATPAESFKAAGEYNTAVLAKLIRDDIKMAMAKGELPQAKYSVKTKKFSGGSSITVRANELPFQVLNSDAFVIRHGHLDHDDRYSFNNCIMTPEAVAVEDTLKAIVGAYNYDRSDSRSDYFHVRFYEHIYVENEGEREQIEIAKLAAGE